MASSDMRMDALDQRNVFFGLLSLISFIAASPPPSRGGSGAIAATAAASAGSGSVRDLYSAPSCRVGGGLLVRAVDKYRLAAHRPQHRGVRRGLLVWEQRPVVLLAEVARVRRVVVSSAQGGIPVSATLGPLVRRAMGPGAVLGLPPLRLVRRREAGVAVPLHGWHVATHASLLAHASVACCRTAIRRPSLHGTLPSASRRSVFQHVSCVFLSLVPVVSDEPGPGSFVEGPLGGSLRSGNSADRQPKSRQ